jgi:hypothetical protein
MRLPAAVPSAARREESVSRRARHVCLVKYCNASCQHKHWPTHKIECKLRAAEFEDTIILVLR